VCPFDNLALYQTGDQQKTLLFIQKRHSLILLRTPEACQEISRGLSERERKPRLSETKKQPHAG